MRGIISRNPEFFEKCDNSKKHVLAFVILYLKTYLGIDEREAIDYVTGRAQDYGIDGMYLLSGKIAKMRRIFPLLFSYGRAFRKMIRWKKACRGKLLVSPYKFLRRILHKPILLVMSIFVMTITY